MALIACRINRPGNVDHLLKERSLTIFCPNTGPDGCPRTDRKMRPIMCLSTLKLTFNFKTVTVGSNNVRCRECQIRTHQNEFPEPSRTITKRTFSPIGFPNQIQAKIRDFFALAVDFESRCLKTFGHGLKQIYKTQFGTIFTRSPTSSSAWKWIFVGHHITLGPCDHMNKAITLVVQRLPQNSENRSHRKIGIQNDNAPFAHDRCHFSCHGGHQCGNTDFGSAFNNRFGFNPGISGGTSTPSCAARHKGEYKTFFFTHPAKTPITP